MRPGLLGGPGPSQGSRGSGRVGGWAKGSAGASGSLEAATAPEPDSRRSWRRHLARRFWNHTWKQQEGASSPEQWGGARRLFPSPWASKPRRFCLLSDLTPYLLQCHAFLFCFRAVLREEALPHGPITSPKSFLNLIPPHHS